MIRMDRRYVSADGKLTQEGYEVLAGLERSLASIASKLEAASDVADASGGGTQDSQARAELILIKAALA